jgi:hypothetical protein
MKKRPSCKAIRRRNRRPAGGEGGGGVVVEGGEWWASPSVRYLHKCRVVPFWTPTSDY